MPNEQIPKDFFANAMLRIFPPAIRASLLEEKAFRQEFSLTTDADIFLAPMRRSFRRSTLFGAIRNILSETSSTTEVDSKDGARWRLIYRQGDEILILTREGKEIILPDFLCLFPDKARRISWFDKTAKKFDLDSDCARLWRKRLESSAIEDEEVDELLSEFRLTPIWMTQFGGDQFRANKVTISDIIPSELRYYERLIGRLNAAGELREFISGTVAQRAQELIRRDPVEGLKQALLLSSHSSFVETINLKDAPLDDTIRVYNWLLTRGDIMSQLAAIECGFRHIDLLSDCEPILVELIRGLLMDNPENIAGRFSLQSSLIVMVYGEMSRVGVGREQPVFWRRAAAFAHASLLEREAVSVSPPTPEFIEWAMVSRGQLFYMQTYLDLRTEPRWLPDFVRPSQLKCEVIGRIAFAAEANASKIRSAELKQLVLDRDGDGVPSQIRFPECVLPGPLEGGIPSIAAIPADIETKLRESLGADVLAPSSFASLVNSALIFQINPEFARLAAEALRRVKYQLRHIKTEEGAFSLLSGLATVAAVTSSGVLAEELRVLMRVVRHRPGINISPEDTTRIVMVAAAGYRDLKKWRKFVGECLCELAFEDMDRDQAVILGQHIQTLCQLDLVLWETCGRADAACIALASSIAA